MAANAEKEVKKIGFYVCLYVACTVYNLAQYHYKCKRVFTRKAKYSLEIVL